MEKVQVTTTDDPNIANPTLEQQLEAQKKGGTDFDAAAAKAAEAAGGKPTEVADDQDRPDWLPKKFATVEDMAKAYGELETKQGKPAEEKTPEEIAAAEKAAAEAKENPDENPITLAIAAATKEFEAEGKLSEATFKTLEESGISRDYVNSYLAGNEVLSNQNVTEIHNSMGGEEAYKAMTAWMAESMTPEELTSFNATMDAGDLSAIKLAVGGAQAKYQKANPKEPNLILGDRGGAPTIKQYTSVAQVRTDMASKRYETDPAFRAEVSKRIAVSSVL